MERCTHNTVNPANKQIRVDMCTHSTARDHRMSEPWIGARTLLWNPRINKPWWIGARFEVWMAIIERLDGADSTRIQRNIWIRVPQRWCCYVCTTKVSWLDGIKKKIAQSRTPDFLSVIVYLLPVDVIKCLQEIWILSPPPPRCVFHMATQNTGCVLVIHFLFQLRYY